VRRLRAAAVASGALPVVVRFGALAILVGAGLAVYAIAVLITGAISIRQLRGLARRGAPPA